MTTEKVKANPDYSNTAVNLCNPPEVMDLLTKRHRLGSEIEKIQLEIDDCIPRALLDKRNIIQQELSETDKELRQAIDQFGSYQNLEYGEYAVKQLRRTKLYSASNFEFCFPEYAPAVLVKSVNVPVLEGLIKGNLLNEDGLRRAHIIEDKESYAYIIR